MVSEDHIVMIRSTIADADSIQGKQFAGLYMYVYGCDSATYIKWHYCIYNYPCLNSFQCCSIG